MLPSHARISTPTSANFPPPPWKSLPGRILAPAPPSPWFQQGAGATRQGQDVAYLGHFGRHLAHCDGASRQAEHGAKRGAMRRGTMRSDRYANPKHRRSTGIARKTAYFCPVSRIVPKRFWFAWNSCAVFVVGLFMNWQADCFAPVHANECPFARVPAAHVRRPEDLSIPPYPTPSPNRGLHFRSCRPSPTRQIRKEAKQGRSSKQPAQSRGPA